MQNTAFLSGSQLKWATARQLQRESTEGTAVDQAADIKYTHIVLAMDRSALSSLR